MDGTLLNEKKEVTPETQKALLKATSRGLIVTACSGRPLQGLTKYAYLFSPDVPVVTYNGGMVVTADTQRVLFSKTLKPEAAIEIIKRGLSEGAIIIVWSDNALYVSELSDKTLWYAGLSGSKRELMTEPELLAAKGIVKIIWMDKPERTVEHYKYAEAKPVEGARAVVSAPEFLEFMDEAVSKSEGLKTVAAYYGIKREEIMAIGDNFNDLDMLKYAGLGVAMGNAPEVIKAAADYVTLSNEDDGIKKVIEEFIFNERKD
jgi:Cof subfamily protein (haloacid dehalogenase superfamily)